MGEVTYGDADDGQAGVGRLTVVSHGVAFSLGSVDAQASDSAMIEGAGQ
jgi:hypothetical protein